MLFNFFIMDKDINFNDRNYWIYLYLAAYTHSSDTYTTSQFRLQTGLIVSTCKVVIYKSKYLILAAPVLKAT